jgi:cell division control protein 6
VISNFLSSFVSGDNGCTKTSLYVSGSPGTGKTALMHELVRNFSVNEGIQVVYINCMGLKDVQAMHQRILEELPKSADSNRKLKGKAAVEHQLGAVSKRCVLVLDELDYLTSTSGALTAIFSLPQANNSKLRVIGIANTHTLTASLPLGEVDSVQTLHFKSYSSEELVQIINCRLSSLHADSTISESVKRMLPANALMLLSKKVATQTGDVRLLFEVLRGAIDRAVNVANKCADPLNTPAPVVTPAHILASLKASSHSAGASTGTSGTSSPGATALVMKVQELGFQPQLVLLMMILAYKRLEAGSSVSSTPLKNGVSSSASHNSIDAIQLHSYYTATLKRAVEATFSPASLSDFMDILGLLEGVGLIRLTSDCSTSRSLGSPSPSKRRKTLSRTASLSSGVLNRTQEVSIAEGVRIDEILRGLGVADDASKTPAKSDIMKEEVRALWRQECSRLAKEIKSREQSSLAKGNVDAAFEDARRSC